MTMRAVLVFGYGLLAYALFLATFLYLVGFVTEIAVPKSVGSGTAAATGVALVTDVALLALFAVQHSVMARPRFKRWWTRVVPPALERSTYVLLAGVCLLLVFRFWQPLSGTVWRVEAPAGRYLLWGLCALGWLTVLLSTYHISHAHLFGLRQVYERLRGLPPWEPGFQVPGLYRHVRHPLMLGFLLAFWATPRMTTGHLLFAGVMTVYILAALRLEERDLVDAFGDRYRRYRRQVPMLVPLPGHRRAPAGEGDDGA